MCTRSEDVRKEAADSGVINFRREGGTATMLLDWCDYKPRREVLALYEFDFDEFDISGELQGDYVD